MYSRYECQEGTTEPGPLSKRARIEPFGSSGALVSNQRQLHHQRLLGTYPTHTHQASSSSYTQHAQPMWTGPTVRESPENVFSSNSRLRPELHVPSFSQGTRIQATRPSSITSRPQELRPPTDVTQAQHGMMSASHSGMLAETVPPNQSGNTSTAGQARALSHSRSMQLNTNVVRVPYVPLDSRHQGLVASEPIPNATQRPVQATLLTTNQPPTSCALDRTVAIQEPVNGNRNLLPSSARPPRQPSVSRVRAQQPQPETQRPNRPSISTPAPSVEPSEHCDSIIRRDHERGQQNLTFNASTSIQRGSRGRNTASRRARGAPTRGTSASRVTNITYGHGDAVGAEHFVEMREQLRMCNNYLEAIAGHMEKTAGLANSADQAVPQTMSVVRELVDEVRQLRMAIAFQRGDPFPRTTDEENDSDQKKHILLANSLAEVMRFLYAAKRCDKFQMSPEVTFNEKSLKTKVMDMVSMMMSKDLENSNLRGISFDEFKDFCTVSNNVGVKNIGSAESFQELFRGSKAKFHTVREKVFSRRELLDKEVMEALPSAYFPKIPFLSCYNVSESVTSQSYRVRAGAFQFLRYRHKVLSETGNDVLRDGTSFANALFEARRTLKMTALKHLKRSAQEMAKGLTEVELQHMTEIVLGADESIVGQRRGLLDVNLQEPILGENDAWLASKIEWLWLKLALSLKLVGPNNRILSRDQRSVLIGIGFKSGNGYSHMGPYLQECLELARLIEKQKRTQSRSSQDVSFLSGRTGSVRCCECTKDVQALERIAASTTPLDTIRETFSDFNHTLMVATGAASGSHYVALEDVFESFTEVTFENALNATQGAAERQRNRGHDGRLGDDSTVMNGIGVERQAAIAVCNDANIFVSNAATQVDGGGVTRIYHNERRDLEDEIDAEVVQETTQRSFYSSRGGGDSEFEV